MTRKERIFEIREVSKNFFNIRGVLQICARGSRKWIVRGLRNPMREVGRITSGTKTISRPQSQGPMPRWRESRELMPVPPATRNNPFLPLPSLSLSLSRSKLHLAASLSRRYYVYNALHGGISQKKANRRAREAWRDRGASASSTGPGGAR